MKRFLINFVLTISYSPLILIAVSVINEELLINVWFWVWYFICHSVLSYRDPFNLYEGRGKKKN